MLECPVCHGELDWQIAEETEERIVNAKVLCKECDADYEVRDEIAVFLTPDLPRNDLWEKAESGLLKFFDENPEVFNTLMETPEDELNGADYWYKAGYFEMKEQYEISSEMYKTAAPKLYTQEYIDGWDKQMDYVVEAFKGKDSPIVDIACGKGYLLEKLLRETNNLIIGTDFSPTILERNRTYYRFIGLYERLSLVAFDARRTPFKDNAIECMTSNLGLQNIEKPGSVIKEMSRITKGSFVPVMQFIDKNDKTHMELFEEYGVGAYATRENALSVFEESNMSVTIENSYMANVEPTPKGVIIEGVGVDGFPVEKTTYEYCVIVAKKNKD